MHACVCLKYLHLQMENEVNFPPDAMVNRIAVRKICNSFRLWKLCWLQPYKSERACSNCWLFVMLKTWVFVVMKIEMELAGYYGLNGNFMFSQESSLFSPCILMTAALSFPDSLHNKGMRSTKLFCSLLH